MRRTLFILVVLTVFIAGVSTGLMAQAKAPWLHLEVKEGTDLSDLIKVNLPLSMVEVALNVIKHEKFKDGCFKLDTHGKISIADLKQLWMELKKAGEAEFVSVEKKEESVKISRSGELLLVKVTDTKGKQTHVDVKVPLAVVDALFSGPGEELNLKAAIQSLQQTKSGEILTVQDHKTQVRLWLE